jgi:hypothetical protein
MPAGGVVQPDGRPPQAKGVGQTARRHDLEAQPGVGNTDLQQGDRQRIEQAQKVAPRPKKQNSGGGAQPAPQRQAAKPAAGVEVPDAIDFIGGRAGGTLDPATIGQNSPGRVDVERWRPLMQEIARDPKTSGALSTALLSQLSNLNGQPSTVGINVVDMNATEDAVWESLQ